MRMGVGLVVVVVSSSSLGGGVRAVRMPRP